MTKGFKGYYFTGYEMVTELFKKKKDGTIGVKYDKFNANFENNIFLLTLSVAIELMEDEYPYCASCIQNLRSERGSTRYNTELHFNQKELQKEYTIANGLQTAMKFAKAYYMKDSHCGIN